MSHSGLEPPIKIVLLSLLSGVPGQRHESNGDDLPLHYSAAAILLKNDEGLMTQCVLQGHDQAPAWPQLGDQGRRNLLWRGGHNDAVEGRVIRPPFVAITCSDGDIAVTETGQVGSGAAGQPLHNLYGVDMGHEQR